jgi:hypothetical protein
MADELPLPPSENNRHVAPSDTNTAAKIAAHIERYIGKYTMVFHEIISDFVHIDVQIVAPSPEHNFYTLITTGMSDLPMKVPSDAQQWQYAEMMICLPADWPALSVEAMQQEVNYWPLRWLKILARMPHQYDTWLAIGHTIPNGGEPPIPFAENTDLCCALISEPLMFGREFQKVEVSPEKTVNLLALVPIYADEMDLKLSNGSGSLFERLDSAGVTELLDIHRSSVV